MIKLLKPKTLSTIVGGSPISSEVVPFCHMLNAGSIELAENVVLTHTGHGMFRFQSDSSNPEHSIIITGRSQSDDVPLYLHSVSGNGHAVALSLVRDGSFLRVEGTCSNSYFTG